jgi:hypothetical protein
MAGLPPQQVSADSGPDKSWHDAFCASLAVFPNVRTACSAVGIKRSAAYLHREAFPEFAQAWERAVEDGRDAAKQLVRMHVQRYLLLANGEREEIPIAMRVKALDIFARFTIPELRESRTDMTTGGVPISFTFAIDNARALQSTEDADRAPGDSAEHSTKVH